MINQLLNDALKSLTQAHELYMEHHREDDDADWVSLQYENAVVCIENIKDAEDSHYVGGTMQDGVLESV